MRRVSFIHHRVSLVSFISSLVYYRRVYRRNIPKKKQVIIYLRLWITSTHDCIIYLSFWIYPNWVFVWAKRSDQRTALHLTTVQFYCLRLKQALINNCSGGAEDAVWNLSHVKSANYPGASCIPKVEFMSSVLVSCFFYRLPVHLGLFLTRWCRATWNCGSGLNLAFGIDQSYCNVFPQKLDCSVHSILSGAWPSLF